MDGSLNLGDGMCMNICVNMSRNLNTGINKCECESMCKQSKKTC